MALPLNSRQGFFNKLHQRKNKEKGLIEVLGETKPKVAVPEVRHVPAPVRRANVPRFVAPGTATDHAPVAITAALLAPSFAAILRRTHIVLVPAVLHPFIYVARRVMQPPGVWRE